MAQDHSSNGNPQGFSGEVIDARGLNCPLPVLKLRKRLLNAASGTRVELRATDRAAARDVPAFCAAQGHDMQTLAAPPGELRFAVTVGAVRP